MLHLRSTCVLRRDVRVGCALLCLSSLLGACSAGAGASPDVAAPASGGSSATGEVGGGGSGAAPVGSAGSLDLEVSGAGNGDGSGGGGAYSDVWPSPACRAGAIVADLGEYCQGPSYDPSRQGATMASDAECGSTLWGIARDFVGYDQVATEPPGSPHPDFGAHYCCGTPQGTVLAALGSDHKPAYNPANAPGDYGSGGVGLTGPEAFAQWYNDAPGVNMSYLVGFRLVPAPDGGARVFSSTRYFPVDQAGFGNFADNGEDGKSHNFGFTTELHTKFKYQGGEVFSFEGDDDLWVFVDEKLAIDLGGIHSAAAGAVILDDFAKAQGLTVGRVYSLDLFNAERHPGGSHFKITTSMTFVDCGATPVPK